MLLRKSAARRATQIHSRSYSRASPASPPTPCASFFRCFWLSRARSYRRSDSTRSCRPTRRRPNQRCPRRYAGSRPGGRRSFRRRAMVLPSPAGADGHDRPSYAATWLSKRQPITRSRDKEKPPVATRGLLLFRSRRLCRQVERTRRSRLLHAERTMRHDTDRVVSGEETSRPFRAARHAGASRVCHRSSSGPSCRPIGSQTSQLSMLGSIAMQPG